MRPGTVAPDTVVVGIDGGGTGTKAVAMSLEGVELGRGTAGPGLIDPLAPARAADAVREATARAVEDAGSPDTVAAIWAGLAGAGREASRSAVERILAEAGVAPRVAVGTDLTAATVDAFPEGPGILVIAGTGSVAWGRGPDGEERRVGGWGAHLGDEGSGYAIGLATLRRVLHASDGRGPPTELTDAVLAALDLQAPGDLVEWGHRATKSQIAALTPGVAEVAAQGDAVAVDVLDSAVHDLAGHVLGLREALGPWPEPPECALCGGLLNPGGTLREALAEALSGSGMIPLDRVVRADRGAANAALRLARSAAD